MPAKVSKIKDNVKQWLLFLTLMQIKKIAKSHVVTTSDFQKTNYLKTNLLKQIKKISTLGSILCLYLFLYTCKSRHFICNQQIFHAKNRTKQAKNN